MLIYYNKAAQSCLKAVLLQQVYKCNCVEYDPSQGNLFIRANNNETIMADSFSLEEARGLYEKRFEKVPWLRGRQLEQLEKMLFYGLRFNASDSSVLALKILNQAFRQGIGVVMGKLTLEANLFYKRARQVWAESHRVKGFIRFTPLKNHTATLVGRAEFQHDIADLLLHYFHLRYPGHKIIILRGSKALFRQGKVVREIASARLDLSYDEHEFDQYWDAYYDSQVIENRQNKKLARKHIPKKLWSWIPEGKKLE